MPGLLDPGCCKLLTPVAEEPDNVEKTAATGAFWMFSASMIQHFIRFFMSLLLARILIPADFGSAALVLSILNLVQIFSELGISVAIVQRRSASALIFDSAFMLTSAMAAFLSAGVWFAAGLIARFFNIADLESLLRVVAVAIIFRTLFSFYRSLMLREMRYRAIAAIEAVSIVLYGLSVVIFALQGFGPFSIVYGQLVYSLIPLMAGIKITRYYPGGFGSFREMYQLFRFGIWVLAGKFIGNASSQFDRFVIGKLLDVTILGSYYLAINLATIIPNSLVKIPKEVMLPIFSRMQNESEQIEKKYWSMIRLTAIVGLPICVLIAVLAEPLILILYGQKWHDSISLLRVFALYAAVQCFGSGFIPVIYATGKPHFVVVKNIFRFIFLPLSILIGSTAGIMGIAWGIVCFEIIAKLFNHGLITRSLKYSFFKYFRVLTRPVLAAACMALVGSGTMYFLYSAESIGSMLLGSIGVSLISVVFYGIVIWRMMPEETFLIIQESGNLLHGILTKKTKLSGSTT